MKSDYRSMMEHIALSPAAKHTIEAAIRSAPKRSVFRPLPAILSAVCLVLLLPVTALGIQHFSKPVSLGQQEITETHAGYTVVAEVVPKATEDFSQSLRDDLTAGTLRQAFRSKEALEAYLGFPLAESPALEEARLVEDLAESFGCGFDLRPQLALDPAARYILTATDWEGAPAPGDPEILKISAHRVFRNTELYLDAWIALDSVTVEQLEEGFLGENFPPVTGWTHEFLYDEEGNFLLNEDGFPVQEHRQFTSTDYTFLPETYEMANGCTATVITARFNEPDGTQGHREYMGYFLHKGILYTLRPYAIYDPTQEFPMEDIDARTVLLEALDSFL